MFHKMASEPWVVLALFLILGLLWVAAAIRIRRDRMLKHRARVDRRNRLRAERDRRWKARH